jgi:hypothetical protein
LKILYKSISGSFMVGEIIYTFELFHCYVWFPEADYHIPQHQIVDYMCIYIYTTQIPWKYLLLYPIYRSFNPIDWSYSIYWSYNPIGYIYIPLSHCYHISHWVYAYSIEKSMFTPSPHPTPIGSQLPGGCWPQCSRPGASRDCFVMSQLFYISKKDKYTIDIYICIYVCM